MDSESDFLPDESEQLDQIEPGRSLDYRGVDDVLDEGYVTPENWSAGEGFGNTAAEMRRGETLEQRLAQEEPDREPGQENWRDDPFETREVGGRRAGRLVDANHGYQSEDVESEVLGEEVGLAGGAASAEEAAMHVISDEEDDY